MVETKKVIDNLIQKATKVSRRNNSLLMRKARKGKDFDLVQNLDCNQIFWNNLKRCKPGFHRLLNSGQEDEIKNNISYQLNIISKKSNLEIEETGMSSLAIGYPFFEGYIDRDYYRGPLVLIPVELKLKKEGGIPRNWGIEIKDDAEITINQAFLFTLRQKLGFLFDPDRVPSWEAKDVNENSEGFWNEIKDFLPDQIINKWSSLDEEVIPLPNMSSKDEPKKMELTIMPYAVMGLYSQGKNPVVLDLLNLKDILDSNKKLPTLVDHLLKKDKKGKSISEVVEEKVENIDSYNDSSRYLVLPADATQEQVILQARRSKAMVVQGPPGTGKSQTIVNLIGDALYHEERVLLVCEKRVALEVVYEELKRLNLESCAVIVGGNQSASNKARDHVYNTLQMIDQKAVDSGHSSIDSITNNIDRNIQKLNKLYKALTEPIVEDEPDINPMTLYKKGKIIGNEKLSRLLSPSSISTNKALRKVVDDIHNWLGLKSAVKSDSIWSNRKPGSVSNGTNVDDLLVNLLQDARESRIISPLYNLLSSDNYNRIQSVDGWQEYIEKDKLFAFLKHNESFSKIFRLEWLKSWLSINNSKKKIKERLDDIKDNLKDLLDYFSYDYILKIIEELDKGKSIYGFVKKMNDAWASQKYEIKKIDKIYSGQNEKVKKDLDILYEMFQESELEDIQSIIDYYRNSVYTHWLKKVHSERPELDWYMNQNYINIVNELK